MADGGSREGVRGGARPGRQQAGGGRTPEPARGARENSAGSRTASTDGERRGSGPPRAHGAEGQLDMTASPGRLQFFRAMGARNAAPGYHDHTPFWDEQA